ncbi:MULTISPECIES: ABC transporter ATP-binding protein [Bacillota]|uniref:ABC transporter ATP-binding protein n=1 Tax=Bacillota TaxID=1239 RepID=UPI0021F8C3B0|nr:MULTISPECIES: ABC transporter ATP-binding protein [Bacillota]MCW1083131.1 ABC transporter ATP-binding protein/permease [Streptococcus anginosus]MDU3137631.1 ABC transporter ATP-binding protein [Anaerococcus prevotii]MDU6182760.1 ABC transporter ATP-binding protein [Anaerococcus vaginalis]
MKRLIMDKLKLTENGAIGVIKSTISFFFYYTSFILPLMVVMFFADGVLEEKIQKPSVYTIVIFIVIIIMYIIISINYQITYNETYKESANLRIEIADYFRKMPMSYFSKHDLSDLAQTIMQDVGQVEHALAHAIGNYLGFIIYFTLMAILMLFGNWKMALAIIIPVLLATIVLFLTKKNQIYYRTKHFKKLRDISEDLQASIEMSQEIKSYGLKNPTKFSIENSLKESEKLQWKSELSQAIPLSLAQYIGILPLGLCLAVGSRLLITGEITLLYFVGFIIGAAKISDGVLGLASYLGEIFYLDARIKRIGEIKDYPTSSGQKVEMDSYDIELTNVEFSYDGKNKVIDGLSFTAKQGEVTALVGPSGCGKSTLLKLISGLYDYDKGYIKIGGHIIKNMNAEDLYKKITVVFQDVTLFNTSVLENIRIGKLDASDEEVKKAAKLAGCEDFISKLPNSYDSFIGENGSMLSGGERQRLSIARAILKDAPIIILDEISSSLDVENELKIQDALNSLLKDKTVIIISHRLKSIQNVDKIVVLNDGILDAYGDHEYLLENSKVYKDMINKTELTETHKY